MLTQRGKKILIWVPEFIQACFQVTVLKWFILDFLFQCVMLNDDHSPLKVELVDAPCVSEFLQPFIHITFAYLSLLGERKESF